MLNALSGASWGQQKETLSLTYKSIIRPTPEYGNTLWSPIISESNIEKLQTIQNKCLRKITGCTRDTNAQHLHDETKILPLKEHFKLHSLILKEKSKDNQHPFHDLNLQPQSLRNKKSVFFLIIIQTLNP